MSLTKSTSRYPQQYQHQHSAKSGSLTGHQKTGSQAPVDQLATLIKQMTLEPDDMGDAAPNNFSHREESFSTYDRYNPRYAANHTSRTHVPSGPRGYPGPGHANLTYRKPHGYGRGDRNQSSLMWLFEEAKQKYDLQQKIMRSSTSPNPASTQQSGAQWLFDAFARSTMHQKNSPALSYYDKAGVSVPAMSGAVAAGPAPSLNVASAAPQPVKAQDIDWMEDTPEDSTDDDFLFCRIENQLRRNVAYRWQTKQLFDLHLTMPICIPYGKVVVESPTGPNFYAFDQTQQPGAHLLFGKGLKTTHDKENTVAYTTPPGSQAECPQAPMSCIFPVETTQQDGHVKPRGESCLVKATEPNESAVPDTKQGSATPEKSVSAVETAETDPPQTESASACDVWASFLHIRLGTIYNLTETDVVDVVTRFQSAFDPEFCRFLNPISIDCQGIYPSKESSASQQVGRFRERQRVQEKYETHGVLTTQNDVARYKMLRRYIKRFALSLVNEHGFNQAYFNPHVLHQSCPLPYIELHDNLRSSTLNQGKIKMIIREWSSLDSPDIFKKVWNKQLAAELHGGVTEAVRAKLLENKDIPSARICVGEIRMEFDHSRMVDPRWTNDYVLTRRIADFQPSDSIPAISPIGRYVFCDRIEMPKVQYDFAENTASAFKAAIASRASEIYEAYARSIELAKNLQHPTQLLPITTPTQFLTSQAEPNFEKKRFPGKFGSLKKKKAVNLREVNSLFPVPSDVCKFYLSSGGCARSENCQFLHPVDPLLEVLEDVRFVSPQHPKYF